VATQVRAALELLAEVATAATAAVATRTLALVRRLLLAAGRDDGGSAMPLGGDVARAALDVMASVLPPPPAPAVPRILPSATTVGASSSSSAGGAGSGVALAFHNATLALAAGLMRGLHIEQDAAPAVAPSAVLVAPPHGDGDGAPAAAIVLVLHLRSALLIKSLVGVSVAGPAAAAAKAAARAAAALAAYDGVTARRRRAGGAAGAAEERALRWVDGPVATFRVAGMDDEMYRLSDARLGWLLWRNPAPWGASAAGALPDPAQWSIPAARSLANGTGAPWQPVFVSAAHGAALLDGAGVAIRMAGLRANSTTVLVPLRAREPPPPAPGAPAAIASVASRPAGAIAVASAPRLHCVWWDGAGGLSGWGSAHGAGGAVRGRWRGDGCYLRAVVAVEAVAQAEVGAHHVASAECQCDRLGEIAVVEMVAPVALVLATPSPTPAPTLSPTPPSSADAMVTTVHLQLGGAAALPGGFGKEAQAALRRAVAATLGVAEARVRVRVRAAAGSGGTRRWRVLATGGGAGAKLGVVVSITSDTAAAAGAVRGALVAPSFGAGLAVRARQAGLPLAAADVAVDAASVVSTLALGAVEPTPAPALPPAADAAAVPLAAIAGALAGVLVVLALVQWRRKRHQREAAFYTAATALHEAAHKEEVVATVESGGYAADDGGDSSWAARQQRLGHGAVSKPLTQEQRIRKHKQKKAAAKVESDSVKAEVRAAMAAAGLEVTPEYEDPETGSVGDTVAVHALPRSSPSQQHHGGSRRTSHTRRTSVGDRSRSNGAAASSVCDYGDFECAPDAATEASAFGEFSGQNALYGNERAIYGDGGHMRGQSYERGQLEAAIAASVGGSGATKGEDEDAAMQAAIAASVGGADDEQAVAKIQTTRIVV
jgi:hypothetical protein